MLKSESDDGSQRASCHSKVEDWMAWTTYFLKGTIIES